MTYESIISTIKKRAFAPIYILQGDEPFYIDKITDALLQNVLQKEEKEFNLSILYGKDVTANELIPIVNRFPMMAEWQLVILKEAQDLKNFDDLATLFTHPSPSTVFIVNLKGKKLDKRKAYVKNLAKNAVIFTSERIKDYNVVNWIKNYCRNKKINIDNPSIHLLSEYLGNDLTKIANELNKLKILVGENDLINLSIIEKNIGISKDYNLWEFQDAISKRNVLKANKIISYFSKNPNAVPFEFFIGSMYNFTTKMIKAKKIPDQSQLMRVIPGGQYAAKMAIENSRNISLPKLEQMISLLSEYDLRKKGVNNGSAEQGALLQEIVYKFLH